MNTPRIRLLASASNTIGDLFTRLQKHLFHALGYEHIQCDVHKPGRELDILGKHRTERRRLVAECKAQSGKIGGDDINKFRGAVEAERLECRPTPISSYFVSLGGFTTSAIEQEKRLGDEAIILLDSGDVIAELQACGAITSYSQAIERAGRCAAHAGIDDSTLDGAELLGHEIGYVWAIFYSCAKERKYLALVHADGTALAEAVARDVIIADKECKGVLHDLTYLAPPQLSRSNAVLAEASIEQYRRWLAAECGEIQLDGLPADKFLSQKRMELERLFVPLKVVAEPHRESVGEADIEPQQQTSVPLGPFLSQNSRCCLLGKAGSGKSTFLKRLGVAYAIPDRRFKTDDQLPEVEWLPLFLRCRELRDRAHRPLLELLQDLPLHAGMDSDESRSFKTGIDDALRSGRALLLVDGLDEIADEGGMRGLCRSFACFLDEVSKGRNGCDVARSGVP